MLSHCMVTVNFVAGTSRLNSAHEATLKICAILSQRDLMHEFLRQVTAEQNLVAADNVSYDT